MIFFLLQVIINSNTKMSTHDLDTILLMEEDDDWYKEEEIIKEEKTTTPVPEPDVPQYYLTLDRVDSDKPLYMVDFQFIESQVCEFAIMGPNMAFNSSYNIYKFNNFKTFQHNLNYTGHPFQKSRRQFRDERCFNKVMDNAVYVVRGKKKVVLLKKMLRKNNRRGTVFTFPERFNGKHEMCPNHKKIGTCAVANIKQMRDYYNL